MEVAVIDAEDEYRRLAGEVGGAYLHLCAPDVRLNPSTWAARRPHPTGPVFHSLVAVLLAGALDPVLPREAAEHLVPIDPVEDVSTQRRKCLRSLAQISDRGPSARRILPAQEAVAGLH